ncbi:hypothetical protein C450_00927 [Halococcus salifodinae DSM 8989]|uniref:Uncharacterized protein n=1 Tax=Halococcus salifodinae DSM 8989 TaxID=1227456 RepID=M0NCK7_9EURY|nr:hypothetical protein C450_00927 [Halococcus salifodinae DSM 8989]
MPATRSQYHCLDYGHEYDEGGRRVILQRPARIPILIIILLIKLISRTTGSIHERRSGTENELDS